MTTGDWGSELLMAVIAFSLLFSFKKSSTALTHFAGFAENKARDRCLIRSEELIYENKSFFPQE